FMSGPRARTVEIDGESPVSVASGPEPLPVDMSRASRAPARAAKIGSFPLTQPSFATTVESTTPAQPKRRPEGRHNRQRTVRFMRALSVITAGCLLRPANTFGFTV